MPVTLYVLDSNYQMLEFGLSYYESVNIERK